MDGDHGYKTIIIIRNQPDGVKISMKTVFSDRSKNMLETELSVNSYKDARLIFSTIFNSEGDYQEAYRELWKINNCMVSIDEWHRCRH